MLKPSDAASELHPVQQSPPHQDHRRHNHYCLICYARKGPSSMLYAQLQMLGLTAVYQLISLVLHAFPFERSGSALILYRPIALRCRFIGQLSKHLRYHRRQLWHELCIYYPPSCNLRGFGIHKQQWASEDPIASLMHSKFMLDLSDSITD